MFREYERHPTNQSFIIYKAARANARKVVKGAKRKSWRTFVGTVNSRTPLKDIWSTVNKFRKGRNTSHIPQLHHRGRILDDQQEIANLLG